MFHSSCFYACTHTQRKSAVNSVHVTWIQLQIKRLNDVIFIYFFQIFASDSFLELTEYSREEILGRNCRYKKNKIKQKYGIEPTLHLSFSLVLINLFICLCMNYYRFLQGPETNPDTVKKIRDAIDNQRDVTVQLINYTKSGTLTCFSIVRRRTKNIKNQIKINK